MDDRIERNGAEYQGSEERVYRSRQTVPDDHVHRQDPPARIRENRCQESHQESTIL